MDNSLPVPLNLHRPPSAHPKQLPGLTLPSIAQDVHPLYPANRPSAAQGFPDNHAALQNALSIHTSLRVDRGLRLVSLNAA
jgi:hypothetical protein